MRLFRWFRRTRLTPEHMSNLAPGEWDQLHAGVRDHYDRLVDQVIDMADGCECGQMVDGFNHQVGTWVYITRTLPDDVTALLLTEAVTRAAVAKADAR